MSNTVVRLGLPAVLAAGAIVLGGAAQASAAEPGFRPLPGGKVAVGVAPGERWNCYAWSTPPTAPDVRTQQAEIVNRVHIFQFGPGWPTFIACVGNQMPFYYSNFTQTG